MRDIEVIENERTEKQKELNRANDRYHLLEDERLQFQKQIIELQSAKKDIEIALNKGSKIIKTLKNDISILTNEFWQRKNS